MIPPVPLALRLAMSAVCIAISKAGFALASWISPELDQGKTSERSEVSSWEPRR